MTMTAIDPDRGMLTTKQVALWLNMTTRNVRMLVAKGYIPATRAGIRELRIRHEDVERYLVEREVTP